VLLELGKALSFFLSILSLYALMASAFFAPGSRWDERLAESLLRIAVAACVCFASGLLFRQSTASAASNEPPVIQTLPVRLFFWALAGMTLLFLLSWYLEEYYVPLLWKNQPH
jgi:cation transport ATPase